MDTEFKEQVTAAEAIVPNHMTYAQYSIREFLPSYIDGLKLKIQNGYVKIPKVSKITLYEKDYIPENVKIYATLKPAYEKIYEGLYDVYPDIFELKKTLPAWIYNTPIFYFY